jgi:hypothetical protein
VIPFVIGKTGRLIITNVSQTAFRKNCIVQNSKPFGLTNSHETHVRIREERTLA